MESLDREFEAAFADDVPARGPGKVLLVSTSEPAVNAVSAALNRLGHTFKAVRSIDDARSAVALSRFDLVLISRSVGEGAKAGSGIAFIDEINQLTPGTRAVVLLGKRSFDDSVLAMRAGAIDVFVLPMQDNELERRINDALQRARTNQMNEDRIARLKGICTKLSVAREEISDQVELLCKELVTAYEDANEQMHDVAMATEFRTLLRQELDLEELLRCALEYLLVKTGPTNAAVFLPDEGEDWTLGAYVNYDCDRETVAAMLDQLGDVVCSQMADETEMVCFEDTSDFAEWIGADVEALTDSQVVAFACMHENRCMAIIVLFRDRSQPFSDQLAGTLDLLRPIFAAQLSQIIRIHHRLTGAWPKQAIDEEYDFHEDGPEPPENFGFGGLAA